jgi:glutathione S-transferase
MSAEKIIWGVELSPFTLKLQAGLAFKKLPFRRLPAHGSRFENTKLMLTLERAKRSRNITRYPNFEAEYDEYPAVPFVTEDKRNFEYDSSSILRRLDAENQGESLLPEHEPARFIAHFIDEAFDEFGLYLVHHMRWVGSARSNVMGKLLASEYKAALPPGAPWLLSKAFPKRQVRRLPYLFSVAPKKYKAGVARNLTPKPYQDFPQTHTLLDQSWQAILEALEDILSRQRFLLGAQFTLADASVYGQLGMNLVDPETNERMRQIAPQTHQWLCDIRNNKHCTYAPQKASKGFEAHISPQLDNLLNALMGTFGALMMQNERAYEQAIARGETLFNESAFNQNKAIYSGKLQGFPFKSVVKTFQVGVWRELKAHWRNLDAEQKAQVQEHMHLTELLET